MSACGVLRGLHFQRPHPQARLVSVSHGSIFDVSVDVRKSSPHFGPWFGMEVSAQNTWQLYVPAGFAHGFCARQDKTVINYECSDYHAPATEKTLIWNDSSTGIKWPIANPMVSAKDAAGRSLMEFSDDELPPFV